MFDKRKEDDQLHPDRKFKGILYTTDQSLREDNDIPVVARRSRPSPDKKKGLFHSFRTVTRKSVSRKDTAKKPARRSARTAAPHTGPVSQPVSFQTSHSFRSPERKQASGSDSAFRSPERKQASGSDSASRPRRNTAYSRDRASGLGGFFRDNFFKTTVLLCAAVLIASSITITTSFAKPATSITLNDSGRILSAETAASTVGDFLNDNRIVLSGDDIIAQDLTAPITEGMEIKIWRAMPITIHSGSESITVNMVTGTVQDALDKAGIVPAEKDEVYPSPETLIRSGMKIDHIVVEVEQQSEMHDIPFEKEEREDSKLAKGDTEIVQEGENGQLEIITELVYKNGNLVSEKVISEETVLEPVTQITAVGTYVAPKKKSTPTISQIKNGGGGSVEGLPVQYTTEVEVTAYCSACNHGNRTAAGTYPQYGTLAANLSMFPFGTKIYIPGYGVGVVQDTGGFGGKTNVIDVYLGERSSCSCGSEWGRKYLTVSVLG